MLMGVLTWRCLLVFCMKRCLNGSENCGSYSNFVCFLVPSFSITSRGEWNRNSGVRFEEPSIEAKSVAFMYKKKLVLESCSVWEETCDALGACWSFLAKIGQCLLNVAVKSTESRMGQGFVTLGRGDVPEVYRGFWWCVVTLWRCVKSTCVFV